MPVELDNLNVFALNLRTHNQMTHRRRQFGYWLSYACWLWLVFGVHSVNAMQAFNAEGFRLCTSAGVIWQAEGVNQETSSNGLENCLTGADAIPTSDNTLSLNTSGRALPLSALIQSPLLSLVQMPPARAPPIL